MAWARGREVLNGAGRITTATPNVKTTTENLAELVAFARALQWAAAHALARGRPICIRYNSEYAARIATGAWKAKKHKDMAAEARRAWAMLKKERGGRAMCRRGAQLMAWRSKVNTVAASTLQWSTDAGLVLPGSGQAARLAPLAGRQRPAAGAALGAASCEYPRRGWIVVCGGGGVGGTGHR